MFLKKTRRPKANFGGGCGPIGTEAMVAEYIDPTYWRKRLIKQQDDSRWIQSVFDSAGVQ